MTITTPERLGDRLTGPDAVGVDELDVNGRSLNRPVPIREFQVRVCEGDAIRSLSEHIIGGQPKCVQPTFPICPAHPCAVDER